MGELILCGRPIAAAPYYEEELSVNLYSLEELSYYVFHNVYLLNSDFMSVDLCKWIGRELAMKELAEELMALLRDNVPLHIFVGKLLNACGYLSATEIRDTVEIIAAFENKSDAERKKIRADRLLEKKRVLEAIYEYEDLLFRDDNAGGRLVGDIWHNLGTAYARLFFFDEAYECFKKAYQKNHRRQSLRSLLFACHLKGDKDSFNDTVRHFQVPPEEVDIVLAEVAHVEESKEVRQFSEEIDHLRSSYSEQSAYRGQLSGILSRWKTEYKALCRVKM
ncbi:MAG: hypothetical protein IJV04_08065 [Lachnospiraceae bacterium]|nr:hypothetical protein [Lachnospiraceae bacterium]